jgi:hypothetical protein
MNIHLETAIYVPLFPSSDVVSRGKPVSIFSNLDDFNHGTLGFENQGAGMCVVDLKFLCHTSSRCMPAIDTGFEISRSYVDAATERPLDTREDGSYLVMVAFILEKEKKELFRR